MKPDERTGAKRRLQPNTNDLATGLSLGTENERVGARRQSRELGARKLNAESSGHSEASSLANLPRKRRRNSVPALSAANLIGWERTLCASGIQVQYIH